MTRSGASRLSLLSFRSRPVRFLQGSLASDFPCDAGQNQPCYPLWSASSFLGLHCLGQGEICPGISCQVGAQSSSWTKCLPSWFAMLHAIQAFSGNRCRGRLFIRGESRSLRSGGRTVALKGRFALENPNASGCFDLVCGRKSSRSGNVYFLGSRLSRS